MADEDPVKAFVKAWRDSVPKSGGFVEALRKNGQKSLAPEPVKPLEFNTIDFGLKPVKPMLVVKPTEKIQGLKAELVVVDELTKFEPVKVERPLANSRFFDHAGERGFLDGTAFIEVAVSELVGRTWDTTGKPSAWFENHSLHNVLKTVARGGWKEISIDAARAKLPELFAHLRPEEFGSARDVPETQGEAW